MVTGSTSTTAPTEDGDMPAYLWMPPSGHGPGLVVLQEIFGVSDYIQSRCRDLAALGYVVLAPELYWRLPEQVVDESRGDFLQAGMELAAELDWETAVGDSVAALTALRARSETDVGVGLVGFCFGGGLAFHVAAAAEPDVLVCYYGSALPQLLHLAPHVTAPSLHHFGTADSYIPLAKVQEIREALAGPGIEFHLHDSAGHAFDNPLPDFHHPDASRDAWEATSRWLHERLPLR